MVGVRVILLVEDDKMDDYIHPHTELETLGVFMCMYMTIVITLFLPPGFSRVLARKMRQPELSRVDPKRVHRTKKNLKTRPEAHFPEFEEV